MYLNIKKYDESYFGHFPERTEKQGRNATMYEPQGLLTDGTARGPAKKANSSFRGRKSVRKKKESCTWSANERKVERLDISIRKT